MLKQIRKTIQKDPALTFSILVAVLLSSCGEEGDRQEVISKLRAVGVEQTPVIATPGASVQLVFHLAGPPGMPLKAQVYNDLGFRYGKLAELSLASSDLQEEKVGALSHYTLTGSFVTPSDPVTLARIASAGSSRVRYGVAVSGAGDDETIVADAHIFDPTAPQATWKAPVISIDQPVGPTISSTTALEATIKTENGETNKVRWFVSSGKAKQKAARQTEWQEASAGDQTLILTARGYKSGAFAIKIAKVTVN